MLGNIKVQLSATLHLFTGGVAQKQKCTKPQIILKIMIHHEHSTSVISHKLELLYQSERLASCAKIHPLRCHIRKIV